VQDKLSVPEAQWDLIVCDEAHKMSATHFGGEIKYTKRYKLGQKLSELTRHFLLMTATPHNGKEDDFQLFMALLDADRFEGRFRDGTHTVDVSDLMRRMVKENLYKFDGTPLFPERCATTVTYPLSAAEAALYAAVTNYVRAEFNRADDLKNHGRAGTIGFALTILQRRLASSPEAIFQSLRRRKERLAGKMGELELIQRGTDVAAALANQSPILEPEDLDDLEDAPEGEIEAVEEQVLDQATAARTIAELRSEIATLTRLEAMANALRRSGEDRKWIELSTLLNEVFSSVHPDQLPRKGDTVSLADPRPTPKLVIFTEHRDTLSYLQQKIGSFLGAHAIVLIHAEVRGRRIALIAKIEAAVRIGSRKRSAIGITAPSN